MTSSTSPSVGFDVLGPLRVTVDGRNVPPPRAPLLRRLLGVLLLAEHQAVTLPRLIDLVWDNAQIRRGTVQVAIARLRGWLAELGGDPGWIEHHHEAYQFIPPARSVDLERFRALAGEAGDTHAEERVRLLEAALELRRGPVLADLSQLDRTDPLLRSVEHAVQTAGVELADAATRVGDPDRAVSVLDTLAADHPLEETLHARLIEALTAAGRSVEALRHYKQFRSRLLTELGVEPVDRVERAYRGALSSDSGTNNAPVPARPLQIPRDIGDFTGRSWHVEQITEMLAKHSDEVIPTVTGMAGVGKTALAVHVAHELVGTFPDGQLYVDLQGAQGGGIDPSDVLHSFLIAMDVPAGAVPKTLEGRVGLYRSLLADRRMLVLLDNAASEQQVRALLPGSSRSAVLITSRVPLMGLENVWTIRLRPLNPEQSVELLASIAGRERAEREPRAAADIARLCEHIPLAVRIVGARLAGRKHWTLSRMAAVLADERRRLDELVVGDLAIRASLALSYRRLSNHGRRVLRMLALLDAPGFTAGIAAAMLDIPVADAETYLDELVDCQLLETSGTGPESHPLHYQFHDLIRLYARERAEEEDDPAESDAAVRRALGAWLWLAERASAAIPGPCFAALHGDAPRTPVPATALSDPLGWFDAEYPSLIAAVIQARDYQLDEYAWDLAGCMEKYFELRRLYDRWRQLNEDVRALCRETGNRRGEAVMLRGLIEVTTWSPWSPPENAMSALAEHARELLYLFEQVGDRAGMADACVQLTWGLIALGRGDEALATAHRALDLASSVGHLGGQARAHHVMAVAYGEARIDLALEHLRAALHAARQLGNRRFEVTVMQFLGASLFLSGDADAGEKLLVETTEMARADQDEYLEAFSLLYLGKLYAEHGSPKAAETAEAIVSLSRRNRLPHHLADGLKLNAEIALAEGRTDAALAYVEESVEIWRSRGWLAFLAEGLTAMGRVQAAVGDPTAAGHSWAEAADIATQLGDDASARKLEDAIKELDGPPYSDP